MRRRKSLYPGAPSPRTLKRSAVLQEKRRSAVVATLLPIAVGHAAAITVALLALRFVQHFLPMNILKWGSCVISFRAWLLSALPREPSAWRRHESRWQRSIRLVLPHGVRARCGVDASAGSDGTTNVWHDAQHGGRSSCNPCFVERMRNRIRGVDTHGQHVGRGWNPCDRVFRKLRKGGPAAAAAHVAQFRPTVGDRIADGRMLGAVLLI